MSETGPNTQRRQLSGHLTRSVGGGNGWGGVIGGTLFLVAGAAIVGIGLGLIPADVAAGNERVVMMFGGLFILAGAALLAAGIRGVRHASRARALRLQYPHEPWRADRDWNPREAGDDSLRQLRSGVAGALFLFVFLVPFYIAFLKLPERHWLALAMIGLGTLIWLGAVAHATFLGIRWLRYGTSCIRLARFPLPIGEQIELSFVPGRAIEQIQRIEFKLQCVEEVLETRRKSAGKSETRLHSYAVWSDLFSLELEGSLPAGSEVPLVFQLPAESNYATQFAPPPVRYWELVVHAVTPGVDYEATFLLPVYVVSGGGGVPG